jgi:hypothetical protein
VPLILPLILLPYSTCVVLGRACLGQAYCTWRINRAKGEVRSGYASILQQHAALASCSFASFDKHKIPGAVFDVDYLYLYYTVQQGPINNSRTAPGIQYLRKHNYSYCTVMLIQFTLGLGFLGPEAKAKAWPWSCHAVRCNRSINRDRALLQNIYNNNALALGLLVARVPCSCFCPCIIGRLQLWLGWAYLAKKNAARRDHAHRNRLQNLY